MLSTIINQIEKGNVPDFMVRAGIRKLCRQRLDEEYHRDIEAQSERYTGFLDELRSSRLAIETDKANEQHYEVPAEFFMKTLGKHLKYSSCYWDEHTETLDEAELNMLQMYLQRGGFEDGQRILELGCGWGSLTLFMAENFPASQITAVSNSASQREHIMNCASERGLENVEIITCDINDFQPEGQFDRIVSIEMFEHVRNYGQLFENIAGWLAKDGKLFVHVFCHRYLMYPFVEQGDDNWMGKYFFSGGQMPSADTFLNFQQHLRLNRRWLVDGRHYEKTSNAWLENMDRCRTELMPVLEATYGQEEAALWWQRWRIFFMSCAELFGLNRGAEWHVAHYLFSRHDV